MKFSRSFRVARSLVMSLLVISMASQVVAQTPASTPDAASPNQAALFAEQQNALTLEGREVVSTFLAGNTDAFLARSAPEVQTALAGIPLDALLTELQTNRLSMDFPEWQAHFDGRFTGSTTMSGFYRDLSSGTFMLKAEAEQTGQVPTGRWNGLIYPGQVEFSITFSGTAEALSATIDIPAQGIAQAPLSNVTFAAEQPIGDLVDEQALPFSSHDRTYAAVLEWGSGYLVFSTVLDDAGTILGFRYTGLWVPAEDTIVDPPQSEIAYRIPADTQVLVYWGGENELVRFHEDAPGQRYGYEFVVWQDGSTYSGDGSRNEDYYIWGTPVVAPASGTVVEIRNDMPDLAPGQSFEDVNTGSPAGAASDGNYVVIQTAEGEWVVLAHLQQGSVSVNVGDQVQAGQALGLVGHSGNVSEPLLHIHAQSTPDLAAPAESGLALTFTTYVSNGGTVVNAGTPSQGEFVAP